MRHDQHDVGALTASPGPPIAPLVGPVGLVGTDQIHPHPEQPRRVRGDLPALIVSTTLPLIEDVRCTDLTPVEEAEAVTLHARPDEVRHPCRLADIGAKSLLSQVVRQHTAAKITLQTVITQGVRLEERPASTFTFAPDSTGATAYDRLREEVRDRA